MYRKVSAVPVIQVVGAYVADDNVGALLTFPVSSGSALIDSPATIKRLTVIDADVEDEEFYLHLFTASPSAGVITDEDECIQVAADLAIKIVTFHIEAADYVDSAGDSIASFELDTAIVYDGKNIYGALQCIGTPTYTAADDLTINLIVEI